MTEISCKICGKDSEEILNKKILNKYNISYYLCSNCGFLQTEKPFWIKEAYENPITNADTGLLARNIRLSKLAAVLIPLYFDRRAKFLDYAGGYGIFTRLMKDRNFNFYWHDPYTQNLFAKGLEWDKRDINKFELLTSFESFEHFENPLEEIGKMLRISDNIFFTTELIPKKGANDWWYLGLEHGQHIAFYSLKTLNYIASKYNLKLCSDGINTHLFTPKKRVIPFKFMRLIAKIKQ